MISNTQIDIEGIFRFYFSFVFDSDAKKTVLPSASSILLKGSNTGQVFNNPYKKAENDQIASLEKHVKMVCTDEMQTNESKLIQSELKEEHFEFDRRTNILAFNHAL